MSQQRFVLHANDRGRDLVRANVHTFVDRLPANTAWDVTITKHEKDYSAKQRRSIFGAAYKALMEFSGLEGDEDKRSLHRFMCGEYFGWKDGAFERKPRRSTTIDENGRKHKITTREALAFYAFLQRRGSEVGCFVPDPDPFWFEKAEREERAAA